MAKVKPLTDEDYATILGSNDPLVLTLRGHQAIEELLNFAISEALADPHVLEIKRLGFALKVDIAAALGAIRDRKLFLAFNRIRNRFAHNRKARLTKRDSDALISASKLPVREFVKKKLDVADVRQVDPLDYLRCTIAFLWWSLDLDISAMRDLEARVRITLEIDEELQRESSAGRRGRGRPSERIRARLAKEKEERETRGEF